MAVPKQVAALHLSCFHTFPGPLVDMDSSLSLVI
jgi:hypothetical protein